MHPACNLQCSFSPMQKSTNQHGNTRNTTQLFISLVQLLDTACPLHCSQCLSCILMYPSICSKSILALGTFCLSWHGLKHWIAIMLEVCPIFCQTSGIWGLHTILVTYQWSTLFHSQQFDGSSCKCNLIHLYHLATEASFSCSLGHLQHHKFSAQNPVVQNWQ